MIGSWLFSGTHTALAEVVSKGGRMRKRENPSGDNLVKRLELLEDEKAILQTLYRYGHCIDYGLEQEWVGLFMEDGIYEIRLRHPGSVIRKEGSQALAQFIAEHTRAPAKYHKHLLVEPLISLEGKNQATVESYFLRVDEGEGKLHILAFGRYKDRLVKHNSRWLFKERICEVEALSRESAA
jgi:hypothetical protein